MWRAFDDEDQAAFAVLSGDANPLHVDGKAARRLMFDRALVHGLHAVIWALDCWALAVCRFGGERHAGRPASGFFGSPPPTTA